MPTLRLSRAVLRPRMTPTQHAELGGAVRTPLEARVSALDDLSLATREGS